MTREKLKEMLDEQKKNIRNAKQAIDDARTNFWTEWLVENPEAPTRERFKVFCEFGPHVNYRYIEHIVSKNGHDMGQVMEFERRQKIEIEDFGWDLDTHLSDPVDPTKRTQCFNYHKWEKPVTEQDVLDWMEVMIEMKFGSMIYEW